MQNQKSIEEDTNQAITLKEDSSMKITIIKQCQIAQIVELSSTIQELDIDISFSKHNLKDFKLENLKVLNIKSYYNYFNQNDMQWNWICKLCKHSKLQELSVQYYECSIQNTDVSLVLNSIKKLTLRYCRFENLDILIPCSNLQEYNIIENTSESQLKDNSLLIKKWRLLNNIDFVQNLDVKQLIICNCTITKVKICNQTLKELNISDCKLEQLDIQELTNLEVLILKSQSLDMNTLSLLMVTQLKRLREISLSGYDLGISLLLNIESIQKISLCQCTNINLQLLNTSIIELSIKDCKFQSNDLDLSHYPKLEVLKLENRYRIDKNITNLMRCSKLKVLRLGNQWTLNIFPQLMQSSNVHVRLPRNMTHIIFFKEIFHLNDLIEVDIQLNNTSQIPRNGILTINNQDIENLEFLQIFDIYKLVLQKCNMRTPIKLNDCIKELTLEGCVLHARDLQSYNLEVLQICNCTITKVKICSQTLKELNISDCKLEQLDIQELTNLEVLILKSQSLDMNTLSLLMVTQLKRLREISLSGYDLGTSLLLNIESIQKISLCQCTNINLQLLNTSIIELSIKDCKFQSNDLDLSHYPKLEVLKLENQNKYIFDDKVIVDNIKIIRNQNRGFQINQLQNFKYLTKLTLYGCSIQNIDVLRRLKNLKELNLAANVIIYLDPLKQLNQLSYLNVYGNNIQDFSPIQGHCNFKKYNIDNQMQIWDYLLRDTNKIQNIHAPITLINDMSVKRCNLKKKLHNTKQTLEKCTERITNNQIYFQQKVIALFRHQNYDDIQ
ncbi:leucine-rich_repeat domain-containing protein [Hexamita inflata]|uniref:Leucine-rich repeat domain-containing protein n=1 Tax=Hexamita inflata TaxID=28002 RepID=A0AA86NZD5_9EUKA|nr:leucine-rich repeat domain-containing protein [Hexamita inflata]